MQKAIFVIAAISFFITLFATPFFIRFFKYVGLTAKDAHKTDNRLVARGGGIPVLAGLLAGLMCYVFIQTFIYSTTKNLVYLFAAITTLILICLLGFFDDLPVLADKSAYVEEQSEFRLRQWQKPLLTLSAVAPLMAVMVGTTNMWVPFVGDVNFGILYPLVFVPIGVIGAANMVNLLEGLNGMGSGMGLAYTGMLGLYAFVNHRNIAAAIAFACFGALLAFYKFHKVPAQIHAGDSLTYLLGAVIACIAILGNLEKAALIASGPFFIEFILKARGRFKKETLGYCDKIGKIHSKHGDKIYSLPHIWMRTGKYTEGQIVMFMILMELAFSSLIWII